MRILSVLFAIFVVALLGGPCRVAAQSTCAKVEIVIEQTLTLEREGFEARLEMENGTPEDISNFSLTLRFFDEDKNPVLVTDDPDAQNAQGILFFHRYLPSAGEASPQVTISAGGRASYKYLIVPTTRAARDAQNQEIANGRLYYVGATISYTQAGQTVTTEVSPDFITVRPMPTLKLEYFLPGDVFGAPDPVEPFPLGVRVVNLSAAATAKKLRIESAQPRITSNASGLLVDFKIIGSEVNGLPATPTLLANLGDIAPLRSATGSWWMTTSLSGRFTALSGEVSHAPEFGGALTSLIPPGALETYRLLGRVRVNFPGSDGATDFVATRNDANPLRTFTDPVGENPISVLASDDARTGPSASASVVPRYTAVFSPSGSTVTFDPLVPPAAGLESGQSPNQQRFYLYARLPAPASYTPGHIVTAMRVGGQPLPPENTWITKRKDAQNVWHYSLNIFDCFVGPQPAVSYALAYAPAPTPALREPQIAFSQGGAPVSGTILVSPTGNLTDVTVVATDDGPPSLLRVSVGSLPYGARYEPSAVSPGGVFSWPAPREPQAVPYEIVFRADDGIHVTRRTLSIRVASAQGGGYDAWKNLWPWPPGTPEGAKGEGADPDGDEIPNLMEYALLGDPTEPDDYRIQPTISREVVDGREYLALTFTRRDDDPLLNVQVVGAANAFAPASGWVEVGTAPLQDLLVASVTPPRRTVRIRDSVPLTAETPRRYLRLVITR